MAVLTYLSGTTNHRGKSSIAFEVRRGVLGVVLDDEGLKGGDKNRVVTSLSGQSEVNKH